MMLTEPKLRALLRRLPKLTVGVLGDFFLDKYLDLDPRFTEKSIETGLDAYQVTRVRISPGAAGTVANNLSALGVGRILALTVIGDDGEGYELRRELTARGVDTTHVLKTPLRRTPTYTKPMLGQSRGLARELNRLDIKNRASLPRALEVDLAKRLQKVISQLDALIVVDQVQETNCGVVTTKLRTLLANLGRQYPQKWILTDSRVRIGQFRNVALKPNQSECMAAMKQSSPTEAAAKLARRCGRSVFCTLGPQGILVTDGNITELAPAHRVRGPIDIVGAGDSATAGIASALAAGATPFEAATVANLIAAITIQQIGTTGTATPKQVLQQFRLVNR